MMTMDGYVQDNNMVINSDLSSFNGKKFLITFYDEGENPYEIKKPIPSKVRIMLDEFVEQCTRHFKGHVKKIILFGSYARGDYRDYSDLDVMILVDYTDREIVNLRSELSDLSFDIGDRNDLIILSPIMQNVSHFNQWMGRYPFYDNIKDEGVVLYESEG